MRFIVITNIFSKKFGFIIKLSNYAQRFTPMLSYRFSNIENLRHEVRRCYGCSMSSKRVRLNLITD